MVFYFSGHGSQQPDRDGDEQGGFDEVFLPYDVGKWGDNGIENAIVDDELNARIERVLEKGADFFGVIDACHSATGFRALDDSDVRQREVDPAELGVPDAAPVPRRFAFANENRSPGRGRAAFFYAAQEAEVALERTPKGGEPGESFGVFTYNLLKRLNQSPDLTYRTLHQAVVDDIKRGNLMSSQTPELEGELLDEPVLRLTQAASLRQWQTWSGKLLAGELHGVSRGTVMALYEDAADPDDKAVAHAVVDAAGATRSTITPHRLSLPGRGRRRKLHGGAGCRCLQEGPLRACRRARHRLFARPVRAASASTRPTAMTTQLQSPRCMRPWQAKAFPRVSRSGPAAMTSRSD